MLLVADDKTVEAAFHEDPVWLRSRWQPTSSESSSKPEAKKVGLSAHWNAFPLKTAHDARRWAREMSSHPADVLDGVVHTSKTTIEGCRDEIGSSGENLEEVQRTHLLDSAPPFGSTSEDQQILHNPLPDDEDGFGAAANPARLGEAISQYEVRRLADQRNASPTAQADTPDVGEEQRGFELSADFRKQFLW